MRHASSACRLLRRCQPQLATGSTDCAGHVPNFLAASVTGNASFAAETVPAKRGIGIRARSLSSSVSGRATVLDGRTVAAAWEKELLPDVQHLTELLGRPPGLGVVLVGSRPDSMLYVTKKQEACQKAGMQTFVHHLPESVTQSQLEAAVSLACSDCRVDGVLIQLPLPRHLSEEAVMEVLDPRKDVDGFHPLNMGRMLMRGRGVRLVPATPLGCVELLRRSGVEVQGKTCVVLGDSNIVGTPLAAMLRDKGAAAVTICHRRSYREWFEDQEHVQRTRAAAAVCLPPLPGPSRPPSTTDVIMESGRRGSVTQVDTAAAAAAAAAVVIEAETVDVEGKGSASGGGIGGEALSSCGDSFQSYQLPYLTRSADILVVAVGHPELVRGDWVRPGAVVIDVGINVVSTLPRTRSSAPAASVAAAAAVAGDAAVGDSAAAAAAKMTALGPNGSPHNTAAAAAASSSFSASDRGFAAVAAAECVADRGCSSDGDRSSDDGVGWTSSSCSLYGGRNVLFQVVGDVAFDEVSQVAGAITPVPGGVGPMTIAAVLHNTLKAAKYRAGLEPW